MTPETLVRMANQIGTFFRAQGEEAVISGVREHLTLYWTSGMRSQILLLARNGASGLTPAVRLGVLRLDDVTSSATAPDNTM